MAEKKYLGTTSLALLWEKIKNKLNLKVDKVDGMGLSSNDYTSAEKTKLSGVASGAQVNVLEGIQKNGSTVTITNKIANITVPTTTSELTNDSGFITVNDVPEGAAASTTTPLMDGTASVGTETAFARGDHRHPTDTSRASASDLNGVEGRVQTLEAAVGSGGSVDSKIASAIEALDSSITSEAGKAIASVTVVDGKITGSTKVTVPTNVSDLTNDSGFQTASDVSSAIANKVDKVTGKGLSTNDYTTAEKTKLGAIAEGAEVNVQADWDEPDATSDAYIANKPSIPQASSTTPLMDGTASIGNATTWARANHVHPTDTSRAPLASPVFTGTPTAPTATAGTNDTQIATTSFVNTAITNAVGDITSFEFEVVQTLPATGEAGVIYLVAHSHGTGDAYDEYIWTGSAYEKIGTTDIDLSGYQLSSELVEITSTEIDTICV